MERNILKKNNDDLPIFPDGLPIIEGTEDLPTLKLSPDRITISAVHIFESKEVLSELIPTTILVI
jgi:hypothetical protein